MKRARTWRPILLLGVVLVGLAWPAPGQEIEDDGALEDTIRGQREQKPINEAPVTDAPVIETKQPSDTTVPPGGEVGRPDAGVRRGDLGTERPPDRATPTPEEWQRPRAREPEQEEKRKRELAEKKERERKRARQRELDRQLEEEYRRAMEAQSKEEKIGLGQGKQPLDRKGLNVTDATLVAPSVGKGAAADTGGAAVPQFDVAVGFWLPSIDIQAGDFTTGRWSLTDDFGVDADQEFSEFSVHYRGGRHSFSLSTWQFGFDGQSLSPIPIELLDVTGTKQTFSSVSVEGEITNLTVKYSLAVRNAANFRLHLTMGGTILLLNNVFSPIDPVTLMPIIDPVTLMPMVAKWEADLFTPFFGGRVEFGPRRLHFYIDAGAYSTQVDTTNLESIVGEAGLMWAPTRWIALGSGFRVLDVTIEETEADPITSESFYGNVELEGATFWLKFIF